MTVASRDVDRTSAKRRQAAAAAVAARKLDLAALDALPRASGGADWQCLAKAIYFESRGEPLDGLTPTTTVKP